MSNARSSASGIILIKYWLEVSKENQEKRFEERIDDYVEDLETQPDGPGKPPPLV